MTKETYESQITGLEEADSDYSFAVYRWSAVNIAGDADQEIKKLKELLKEALNQLETAIGCPEDLAKRVDKALE